MARISYQAPGVYVEQVPSGTFPIVGVGTSTAGFIGVMPDEFTFKVGSQAVTIKPAAKDGEVVLCTNFTEFKEKFLTLGAPATGGGQSGGGQSGGGEPDPLAAGQAALDRAAGFVGDIENPPLASYKSCPRYLAHAVYGFFNNGGTRCYVARVAPPAGKQTEESQTTGKPAEGPQTTGKPAEGSQTTGKPAEGSSATVNLLNVLEAFETIDEIAIVAAPGITGKDPQTQLITHCAKPGLQDRVAVLDGPPSGLITAENQKDQRPGNSEYAAYYYPWIEVFDPLSATLLAVPPSGHVAGVYARVDTQRGVHKAPANEVLLGAVGVSDRLSRSHQEGLNPAGINCIRDINGNIRVWGARTLGGDANGEFKYINVRRLFNFLRKSIDQGTQWAVFEPNDPQLWARITRNVSAFLTTVWSAGGLFGNTPQEAFYVKCDAETNPPANRDNGLVITEVGVAITRPAEFVVFRLSQSSGLKR